MRYWLLLGLLMGGLAGCGGDETGAAVEPTLAVAENAAVTPEPIPATAIPLPSPTFVPTSESGFAPANEPESNGEAVTNGFRFDDRAWTGGWRNRGESVYGGRTATWIYGVGTDFAEMRTTFELETAPSGQARLAVEGMDDENGGKSRITIDVNGTTIYEGDNPLPNDDMPLQSGTWATYAFEFDAQLLQAGRNTITIRNHSPGAVGRPPFFMLDYAELLLQSR